jgi:hypothetical protein
VLLPLPTTIKASGQVLRTTAENWNRISDEFRRDGVSNRLTRPIRPRAERNLMSLVIILMVFASPLLVLWLIGAWKSKRESPRVAPTPQQRRKKMLNLALNGYFGLGLLVWPLAVFVSFFAFDSPPRTLAGWAWGLTFVISIWCYPAFWAAGLFFGIRSVKRDEATWLVVLKSSIPLLSGLWLLVYGLVLGFLQELPMFAPPRPDQPPAASRPAE